ncbi:MAG: hypothetical protein QNI92_18580 [Desulfobacterales bacterium]|nr:hypothetical protein [Desulfobacterales bacterium]MDJ0915356.1 hypothetical protein [Desulfobacterales bacterium]
MTDRDTPSSLHIKTDITRQLERMQASSEFRVSPQQSALFIFLVNQTLKGNQDNLTESCVATQVFSRRSDFDPHIDPIVSIQADLLRYKLAQYYATAGQNDPIHIDIPPGTYIPVFVKRNQH